MRAEAMMSNGTIEKRLREGKKTLVAVHLEEADIEWGDKVYIVPLPASIKKGDILYCKVSRYYHDLMYLRAINKDGTFYVSYTPKAYKTEWELLEFNHLLGILYEVKKPVIEPVVQQPYEDDYDDWEDEDEYGEYFNEWNDEEPF